MKNLPVSDIKLSVFNRVPARLLLVVLFLLSAAHLAQADVKISSGTFLDSSGAEHSWHVNPQHTLIWGGQPWIPAGGLVQSRYLTGPQSEENWKADQADLQTLKQHGIRSLVLVTSSELDPITDLPPADLQRVLDYLDRQGFQYGLALSSFPRDPVEATIVNPAIYRVASPQPGSVNYFSNISGLVGATYYLVSETDGSISSTGPAKVNDNQTASVTLPPGQGGPGTVLLLYPKRIFLPDSIEGAHLPDIWSQTDSYRDSLLLYFSKIKFGSGLRFFLDPAVAELGYYGSAAAGAIPDGAGYRLQFQMWLENRYNKSLPQLNTAWGVRNQDIFDFAAASRCFPLWYQSKGVQRLVDPVSNKSFETIADRSQFWADVQQFRSDSMRSMMDELASALKNGVADVPVIYRWTRPSKMYVDNDVDEGYDGLMVTSGEHADALARDAAGWALSEAEQSSRSTWLLGELSPLQAGTSPGYVDKMALLTDGRVLQALAIKGYFIDSFRKLPESDGSSTSLLNAPAEQLDWVHADDANFSIQATPLASFVPTILFYPIDLNLPSTGVRQFDDGTWWLPSYHTGLSIDIGPGLKCYSLDQPGLGKSLVLWSPGGTVTTAQFKLPKNSPMTANNPQGQVVTVQVKKDVFTVPTSKTPLIIRGVSTLPLIANATALEMLEAQRLINEGVSDHIPMDADDQQLYYIKNEVLGDGSVSQQRNAYALLVGLVGNMQRELDPNAWVEGEAASQQSFGTVVESSSASGGAFLWQDTDRAPVTSTSPYEATYTLYVGAPGDYTVWASLAPDAPGTGSASPLAYSLDTGTQYDVSQPDSSGSTYGNLLDAATTIHTGGFRWYRLGALTMTPGPHNLNFVLTGPAPVTHRYTLGIDAICLSRGSFVPNGAQKPTVD
jgi:hypothetical protein